jgi:hypothetical protein
VFYSSENHATTNTRYPATDTYTFGFNAHTHSATNITLNNRTISLPSPSLNITAASLIEQSSFYCQDPFTNHYQGSPTFDYQNCLFSPFSASNKFQNPTSSSNILYTQSGTNTTYPVSFLVDNGTCQQLATVGSPHLSRTQNRVISNPRSLPSEPTQSPYRKILSAIPFSVITFQPRHQALRPLSTQPPYTLPPPLSPPKAALTPPL